MVKRPQITVGQTELAFTRVKERFDKARELQRGMCLTVEELRGVLDEAFTDMKDVMHDGTLAEIETELEDLAATVIHGLISVAGGMK